MTAKSKSACKVSPQTDLADAPKSQAHDTPSPSTFQESWTSCGNSAEAQRQRLMEHFKRYGSIDTVQARRDLDIMHPAGRVQELREAGEPIKTILVPRFTTDGKKHNVARYLYSLDEGGQKK